MLMWMMQVQGSLTRRTQPMPIASALMLLVAALLMAVAPVVADEVDDSAVPVERVEVDAETATHAMDEAPAEPVAADAEPVADAADEAPVAMEEDHAPASHDAAIVRAVFTSAVDAREPVDQLDAVAADATELVFFTELAGLADRRVSHHWEGGERPPFAVDFDIGGDHWRVWSQRTVMPDDPGPWVVSVRVDGEALAQFTVGR